MMERKSNVFSPKNINGFALLELMIALAIVTLIAAIGIPAFFKYVESTNNTRAIGDVRSIEMEIDRYFVTENELPDLLADIGMDTYLDPWGNPYEYLRIQGAGLKGLGKLRKDRSLVPVNSDYDLYSKGKDGRSVTPFTAKASHDDIVRCNNGDYVGLASEY